MSKGVKKVVCLGGGTGVSMILSGLVDFPLELSAIVTVFDDGGSSGKLARDFHILPPGDIRQCLIATSKDKDFIKDFHFRFDIGPFKGHNLGNLLIVKAVKEEKGNWDKAIRKLSKRLNIKAKIYPITLRKARITATLKNNKKITGEESIINSKSVSRIGIKDISLNPESQANPKAISAIKNADVIIIGPGKFYTSVLPNLLVDGVSESIRHSKGKKIFICNLMTQEGNTDNFKVEDFVRILEKYLGKGILDYVIFNTEKLKPELMKKVRKIFPKAEFIDYDSNPIKNKKFIGGRFLDNRIRQLDSADILVKDANQRTIVFHDSKKLAKVIYKLCRQ